MDELKSKSQKKRDADAMQELGVALIALRVEKLMLLPLTEPLKRAIIEAKALTNHGALRRQSQWIGKLMRAADYEAIKLAYESLTVDQCVQSTAFREAERWRQRLMEEGKEALTLFIDTYHPEDVQHLRQLIKKATNNSVEDKTIAIRALFRYVRAYL